VIAELARFIARRRMPDSSTDPRVVAFARGLALGALVGAAIAGSSIWNRRRHETDS
jgi:hypothetical protein